MQLAGRTSKSRCLRFTCLARTRMSDKLTGMFFCTRGDHAKPRPALANQPSEAKNIKRNGNLNARLEASALPCGSLLHEDVCTRGIDMLTPPSFRVNGWAELALNTSETEHRRAYHLL